MCLTRRWSLVKEIEYKLPVYSGSLAENACRCIQRKWVGRITETVEGNQKSDDFLLQTSWQKECCREWGIAWMYLTDIWTCVVCPQDYPSLALLGEKLAENNIFLIFAVTKRHYVLYKVLLVFYKLYWLMLSCFCFVFNVFLMYFYP